MLSDQPFYHSSIRKILIAFGKLFTNLEIGRKDSDGNLIQRIKVPVQPGSREKWLARIQEDPNLAGTVQISLPRIGFEIVGFQYDASRQLPVMNMFKGADEDINKIASSYAPVPYNIEFSLYVACKTQGDALQIVEQILPYFTPGYTVTVDMFPEVGIQQDIPFSLVGVSMQDDYEGPFEQKRIVIYTLNFTAKTYILGPAKAGGNTILHTRVRLGEDKMEREHSWDVEDGEIIDNGWKDLE